MNNLVHKHVLFPRGGGGGGGGGNHQGSDKLVENTDFNLIDISRIPLQ